MKAVASNCGCCAIKHIRDFVSQPSQMIYIDREEGHDEDQESTQPAPFDQFEETEDFTEHSMKAGDYLKFLVKHIKERRPAGMITLNLASYREENDECEEFWNDYQVQAWHPLLTELGFSVLPPFINSNSSNRIHHYFMVYDEGDWED